MTGTSRRRLVIAAVLVLAMIGGLVFGYTYLHPFNRYRRAALGWVAEHNSIVETALVLIDDYHGRDSANGFRAAYELQVADEWVALESEIESYDPPDQVAKSHALLLEAVRQQSAASQALLDESGDGQYTTHQELGLRAMQQFPAAFRQERMDWIGK